MWESQVSGCQLATVDMGKRPDDPLECQTPGDLRIFIHIQVVVVVDELVTQRLAENQPDNRRQKKADPGDQPAVIQTRRRALGFQGENSPNEFPSLNP